LNENRKSEFLSIQYLRAVASLGVVLTHASTSLLPYHLALLPLGFGNAGVDLFFVISGFLMFYTTARKPVSLFDFYAKRIIRIVPIYFIFSTVAFLLAKIEPQLTLTFSPKLTDYLRSIFFIPFYSNILAAHGGDGAQHLVRPEIGQGWTLNYEIFFYLLFGLLLGFTALNRVRAVVSGACFLVMLGIIFRPAGSVLTTYTDPLLLEFAFGVVLAYLLFRQTVATARPWMGVILSSVGVALLIVGFSLHLPLPRVVTSGIPAAMIVGGFLWTEAHWEFPKKAFFLLLGDSSYSLYLSHTFVLAILRRLWQRNFEVEFPIDHMVFVFAGVICSELVGILCYLMLEQKITGLLNGLFFAHKRPTLGLYQQSAVKGISPER